MKPIILGSLVLTITTGCVSNQKYLSAENDLKRLKRDSVEWVQAQADADRKIEKLNKQNESFQAQLIEAKADIAAKDSTLLAATKVAVRNELKLDDIAKNLDMFNTKFSEVIVEDGHVKLVMGQDILFNRGSTTINWQGDILLERLAATLNKANNIEVAVEGHTDPIPVLGEDNNWDLSVDRSIAVIERLTKKYGVAPSKLVAAGKSKFDPAVPNMDQESMALNRRVEFIIMPDLDQIESEIDD